MRGNQHADFDPAFRELLHLERHPRATSPLQGDPVRYLIRGDRVRAEFEDRAALLFLCGNNGAGKLAPYAAVARSIVKGNSDQITRYRRRVTIRKTSWIHHLFSVGLKVDFKSSDPGARREHGMIDPVITIGELSRRTGIPSSTLRYWEREKVLPKPIRISGQRRYSAEAADLVAVLQLAQACGFSLPEMRRLLSGFQPRVTASERWRTTARDHRKILEEKIARLREMSRLLHLVEQCKCPDLTVCGRRAKSLLGSRATANKRPSTMAAKRSLTAT